MCRKLYGAAGGEGFAALVDHGESLGPGAAAARCSARSAAGSLRSCPPFPAPGRQNPPELGAGAQAGHRGGIAGEHQRRFRPARGRRPARHRQDGSRDRERPGAGGGSPPGCRGCGRRSRCGDPPGPSPAGHADRRPRTRHGAASRSARRRSWRRSRHSPWALVSPSWIASMEFKVRRWLRASMGSMDSFNTGGGMCLAASKRKPSMPSPSSR